MANDHLFRQERNDVRVDIEFGQVDGGNAVLLGKELSEVILLDGAHFDEGIAQALARLLALLLSTLQLLGRDDLVPKQKLPESTHVSPANRRQIQTAP